MDSAFPELLPDNPAAAVTAAAADDVRGFPLPLSEFEEYMLCDDRPSHPMVIVMLADVSGQLHRQAFQAAVQALIQRQPLLRCRIDSLHSRPVWVPLRNSFDPVIWTTVSREELSHSWPTVQPLDIRSGPGLRIRVWCSPTASRIAFELHHACADGIAAVQLLNELFAEYAARTDGQPVPPASSETALLRSLRGRSPLLKPQHSAEAPSDRTTPLHVLVGKLTRLLGRRPVRIANSQQRQRCRLTLAVPEQPCVDTAAEARPFPAIFVRSLPDDTVRRLRAAAVSQAVGLNDLLLLQMLTHVTAWNTQARCGTADSWVRIAVPVSMRDPRTEPLPACNLVSYALLTHRMRECRKPQTLLQQIHEKTVTMRSGRDGMIALKIFRLLRRVPCGVRAFLSLWPCAGTLVLANVGNVIRRSHIRLPLNQHRWIAGNITVERICGVPPVRPHTLAAVGLTEYASQLHISLRTDGTQLTVEDSEVFLEEFVARLMGDGL
ncbi:MAG: condensation domain-containing protein [Planctomycetota bacterium]